MGQPTLAQNFKAKAAALVPSYTKLQTLVHDDMTSDQIDQTLFGESELLSGMAFVILSMINEGT